MKLEYNTRLVSAIVEVAFLATGLSLALHVLRIATQAAHIHGTSLSHVICLKHV